MGKKDKTIKKIENKIANGLPPLERELFKFLNLVRSSGTFFDLRWLKVQVKDGRAYFVYGKIIQEFPIEILREARNGN